jgi:hypothetical protein
VINLKTKADNTLRHTVYVGLPEDKPARTLPLGSVSFESATNENGERLIWLKRAVVDRLRALRGPGESYSDVILRWRRRVVRRDRPRSRRRRPRAGSTVCRTRP